MYSPCPFSHTHPHLKPLCQGLPQVTAVGAVDSSHARQRHIWCGVVAEVKHKHKAAGYASGATAKGLTLLEALEHGAAKKQESRLCAQPWVGEG